MSKGSARRPTYLPLAELAARWDATFGRKDDALANLMDRFVEDRSRVYDEATRHAAAQLGVEYLLTSPSAPDERPTE